MFCHKCGAQIAEGSAFCHKCGTKVVYEHLESETADTKAQDVVNTKALAKKISAKVIGSALVVIALLALIMTGKLQDLADTLTHLDQAILAESTDSTLEPGMQSASDLFRDTEVASTNSTESSFAWVEDPHMVTEDDIFKTRYIVGELQNISDISFTSVGVHFILYDAAGNQVDTTADVINYFKAGNTWKFKAVVLSADVTDFEFLYATKAYPNE